MAATFFFYDLETSGFDPRNDRIMQFGGQRTDLNLKLIGEPINVLIKMTSDVLPNPDAIMITKITPQQTISEGLSEAEFVELFDHDIAQPDTIFVGYNTIRFDDEFMRFLFWRNFYDAYEWHWKDGRSRWDLLDVVRMTRALRPKGIKWPVTSDGKSTNRLEMLASMNGLTHSKAHDALSDVNALIELARLIKTKQPKLFEYLLKMRDKNQVAKLVNSGQPFIYSSGKYDSEFEKTTVVMKIADHPESGVLVYDLRKDPTEFISLTPQQLVEAWKQKKDSDEPRLPVKTLKFNRCPAVAPLNVLVSDKDTQKRLKLNQAIIENHRHVLAKQPTFIKNILEALSIMNAARESTLLTIEQDVDGQLYDGFIPDVDRTTMVKVRKTKPEDLNTKSITFYDKRLKALLPLYKARNFPKHLTEDERIMWEEFKARKLSASLEPFFKRLQELSKQPNLTSEQTYLLEELKLYGQSVAPVL